MNPSLQELRGKLERIAWKHYDPESSINVEEMLDEMMPVVERMRELGVYDGSMKQMILDGKTIKEQIKHAVEAERARILQMLPEDASKMGFAGGLSSLAWDAYREKVLALLEGEKDMGAVMQKVDEQVGRAVKRLGEEGEKLT